MGVNAVRGRGVSQAEVGVQRRADPLGSAMHDPLGGDALVDPLAAPARGFANAGMDADADELFSFDRQKAGPLKPQDAAAVPGAAERLPDSTGAAKYGTVLGIAGASFGTGAGLQSGAGLGGAQAYGGGGATGFLGAASMGDAAMGIRSGYGRKAAARKSGDKAGERLGQEKMEESGWGVAAGGLGAAKSGVDIATVQAGGKVLGATQNAADLSAAAGNALSVAGAATGIAGSAVSFVQAAYHGGKAIGTWKAAAAAAKDIKTAAGQRWHQRAVNRAQAKTALQGVKLAAAAIGVAAGVLALVSNPVGWAIGIAAAVTMGAIALGKLGGKVKRAYDQKQAAKKVDAKKAEEDKNPAEKEGLPSADAIDDPKRKRVRGMADEAAALCSTNAAIAREMRGAVGKGQKAFRNFHAAAASSPDEIAEYRDALIVLGVLDVTEDQAASESGQELVENKLSAVSGL